MIPAFPTQLLTPRAERWWLRNAALGGGTLIGGTSTVAMADGGGLWVCEQEIFIHSRAQIKAARAIQALLDGGATTFFVPAYEAPFAPYIGGAPATVPHSDGAPFSDDSEYVSQGIVATAAAAALRATRLTATISVGDDLEGGERFSFDHTTKGKRLYTVAMVGDQLTIRPPLREAIGDDTNMDFDNPGCLMRLANPDEFMSALDVAFHAVLTPVWVEAF